MDITTRDKVWMLTIAALTTGRSFRLGDLPVDDSERVTAGRVWRNMEHLGLLRRTEPGSKTWQRGPRAQRLLAPQGEVSSIEWDDENEQVVLGGPQH